MTRRHANVLIAAAIWTFYVWISRIVIMTGQNTSTGFKVVHYALAAVSLAFGTAIAWIAFKARKSNN